MDRENISKLMRDLNTVHGNLKYLKEHPERNFDVTGPSKNYLMPFFWGDFPEDDLVMRCIHPLEHEEGLFVYYTRIEDIIEKALSGRLVRDELPPNAPVYLEAAASEY